MSELKVTSKKYNDKDVLEVDNLGEAVNEEIEAGKIVIPAGGTQLCLHSIKSQQGNYYLYIIDTTETQIDYAELVKIFGNTSSRKIVSIRYMDNSPILRYDGQGLYLITYSGQLTTTQVPFMSFDDTVTTL